MTVADETKEEEGADKEVGDDDREGREAEKENEGVVEQVLEVGADEEKEESEADYTPPDDDDDDDVGAIARAKTLGLYPPGMAVELYYPTEKGIPQFVTMVKVVSKVNELGVIHFEGNELNA